MRISTSTLYDLGVNSIQQQSSAMVKTQQQLASGRRILTPADDPVGAARVLEVSQAKALNQQYDVNTNSASSALSLEEGVLQSVDNLILDVKDIVNTAGGSSMTETTLKGMATNLRGRYQELLGLANSKDANGQYIFSGYKGATEPFLEAPPGTVAYIGDQGQRRMQISPSRQIEVSDAGSDVFMKKADLFKTIEDLAQALDSATGPSPALTASLTTASSNLNDALQQVLTVHASVGTRMNEVDSIKSSGQDTALQYDQTLSGLQDLDYAKATTDLSRQTAGLQAALQSFMKIQGLSLFNYMN